MKVIIIGTGNVATVLGKKIMEAGHEIMQVTGRNFERCNTLAAQLNANAIYNLRYINLSADIYIIAVSDSSIASVAGQLRLKDKIVVHTAAAVAKEVLEKCSINFGILYPLQSLIKEIDAPAIPVLIDANNETTRKTLIQFSSGWAEMVQAANEEERLKLHVAAIFVNNFTNYIFSLTERYCKEEQVKFNLLYFLIEETATRLKLNSPSIVQTGPAARKDVATIEKHNQILQNHPQLLRLYNILTNEILGSDTIKS